MTRYLLNNLWKLARRDQGATMVEYALMLALVVVVCVAAITTLGSGASALFTSNGSTIINSLNL